MKAAFLTLLAGLVLSFAGAVALAEDEKGKEVELKGELGCPKCVFKLDKKITGGKCGNAIQVTTKKDDKEVKTIYVFIDEGGKEDYHKAICTAKKAGSVKGVVSKKKDTGDQLYITPTKDSVKYD
jgi:hypothetical protein